MPLRVNLSSMSDMELQDHLTAFREEQTRRNYARKQADWNELAKAIQNYVHVHGSICFDFEDDDCGCTTVLITENEYSMNEIGTIEIL